MSANFMQSSLEVSGFRVILAETVAEAMRVCKESGAGSLRACLCDYRLPDETGISFLKWLRQREAHLAVVIVTGQGEKSVVQQAMAAGAFDYLEKPVTHQILRDVLGKAVAQTDRQRQSAEDRQELQELEQLDQSIKLSVPEAVRDRLRVFYRPLHETGGDFFMTLDRHEDSFLLLVGDVSGHDLGAGYVSTYFKGMFKGCMESGASIEEALRLVNTSLREDAVSPGRDALPISLCISVVECHLRSGSLFHWNFGLPPCQMISRRGFVREAPFGRSPLGWFAELGTEPENLSLEDVDWICIFTDGLVELATDLELDPFSLLYRFNHGGNDFADLPFMPADDILILYYSLNPVTSKETVFEPILSEHYAGTEIDYIDHLQSTWRRSINFALGDRLGDRLYDLLICIREGMLNAFIHGCERSAEKFAHLQISVNEKENLVRVRIDDPGRGHHFDLKKRLEELSQESGKHLGLGIIQHLSDDFAIENEGTTLLFDFEIELEEA